MLEVLVRCGILELHHRGSSYRWNADFDWEEYGVEEVERVSFRSQTLRQSLRDWTDPDISPYYVAVALGVASDPGEEWDFWGGHKWMFWSANPLGEGFFGVVLRLLECGVLEEMEELDDYVTRWNQRYSRDEYEREIPEEASGNRRPCGTACRIGGTSTPPHIVWLLPWESHPTLEMFSISGEESRRFSARPTPWAIACAIALGYWPVAASRNLKRKIPDIDGCGLLMARLWEREWLVQYCRCIASPEFTSPGRWRFRQGLRVRSR